MNLQKDNIRQDLRKIIHRNRVWYCLECGKCSAVCPVTPWERRTYTSPRLLVEKAVSGHPGPLFADPLFWSCLTCRRCSELCPSAVGFCEFLREARSLARGDGRSGDCTHGGVIETWGRMMTDPDLTQNRLHWLGGGAVISENADTVYFTGCLPYYDVLFRHLNIDGIAVADAALHILNTLGIAPQVMVNERCCGHDQLWEGDVATFTALARLNMEALKATGARRVVTTCPECARTLALDYPQVGGDHGMEVLHITQLINQKLSGSDSEWGLQADAGTVTYQDPCRLGRHLGIYGEPRALITAMGYDLVEMQHNRQTSICCGTSGWTACGAVSKNIQIERLREAVATGAEMLTTACIKCQIHLKCAQQGTDREKIQIPIRDLTTVFAQRLGWHNPARKEAYIGP